MVKPVDRDHGAEALEVQSGRENIGDNGRVDARSAYSLVEGEHRSRGKALISAREGICHIATVINTDMHSIPSMRGTRCSHTVTDTNRRNN